MTQTQEKFVRYETDGKVGIITLDRATSSTPSITR